jgi:hypothetical protein
MSRTPVNPFVLSSKHLSELFQQNLSKDLLVLDGTCRAYQFLALDWQGPSKTILTDPYWSLGPRHSNWPKVEKRPKTAERRLIIRLPRQPATVAELRLVRFWLRALSDTCFELFSAAEGFFTPGLVQRLFPDNSSRPIRFRAAVGMDLSGTRLDSPVLLAPYLCARNIKLWSEDGRALIELAVSTAVHRLHRIQVPGGLVLRQLIDVRTAYNISERAKISFKTPFAILKYYAIQKKYSQY